MAYLNSEDSARYRLLRKRREQGDTLTSGEVQELSWLEQLHESVDSAHLAQASARVKTETQTLGRQNKILRDLLVRKQALADRLEAMLAELHREQQAMDTEIAHLLTPTEVAQLAATRPS